MQTVSGDLLKLALAGKFDVIVHGANCFCTMGAGIAKGIRETFPAAFAADQATRKGDRAKLGSISVATVRVRIGTLVVVNAYTQFDYRGRGVRVDYDAVRACFAAIKSRYAGKRIGYPRIGAGLARGDWARLAAIIDAELDGEDHTLVEYTPPAPSSPGSPSASEPRGSV